MQIKPLQTLLICLLSFLMNFKAEASHVVGGDLTYKHLVKDSFEITLILYIDCYNGNPTAISQDADGMIGIFDTSGNLSKSLLVNRSLPTRINSVNYNCVVPPSNACVDKYVYVYYTNLPQINGGYILTFQRCCRNVSLSNIMNPSATGATYWTAIKDTVQTFGFNNSATFNALPPNFLCNNFDFVFNHSASDADGDSLAYELYAPFSGADQNLPLPRPPAKPPYYPVVWQTPFGVRNMMQGAPELTIDSISGLIKVKPKITGQFVTGIAVKEFRKGKLINITRRDFQFNVLSCQFNVISSFAQDIKVCSDTVHFINYSQGADSFFWDFGDSATLSDTSTQKEPTYIYPGTGNFIIQLIASKGNCIDTSEAMVTTYSDTAHFAGNDTNICIGQSVLLGISDTGIYSYQWHPALFLNDSTLKRPLSTPAYSISYVVTRNNIVCTNTDTILITVTKLQPDFNAVALINCKEIALQIDSIGSFSQMNWFLNNEPILFDKLISSKLEFGKTYTTKLEVSDGHCFATIEKTLTPQLADTIAFIPNIFTPNGDQANDCYFINHIQLSKDCANLLVYNRWGELMYNSDTDGNCWNGTVNGKKASEGVYFYILRHRGKDYHGTITLIR